MATELHTLGIAGFHTLFPDEIGASVGNDLYILDVRQTRDFEVLRFPCRFDGYLALFCEQGGARVEVNLDSYDIRENHLLIVLPGNILRVKSLDPAPMHFVAVAVAPAFLQSLRVDFKRLLTESLEVMNHPCLYLEGEARDLSQRYLDLLIRLSRHPQGEWREAVLSLCSSLFYLIGALWQEHLAVSRASKPSTTVRSRMVFERFMQLVTEYHAVRRDMGFYAEQLSLTPKYLSKIVRQVSGRSGPDWIDSFVILEAKHLLKYSNASIKEIVYSLHFPNQSVFYKFFKTHTGQTPSQYRNS